VEIDSGIGCGYYNISDGGDNREINAAFNEYLFNCCFNPQISENNYQYFLETLLINYSNSWAWASVIPEPSLRGVLSVLDENKTKQYWLANAEAIKAKKYELGEQKIITVNTTISYAKHLNAIYKVLDEKFMLQAQS